MEAGRAEEAWSYNSQLTKAMRSNELERLWTSPQTIINNNKWQQSIRPAAEFHAKH